MKSVKTVDEYIALYPKDVQVALKKLRATIKKIAPKAEEKISYSMLAFMLNGPLVYFGGYTKHIGLYPTPSGISAFQKEISKYKSSKGAVQFPIDEPLPWGLITKIITFKLKENLAKNLVGKSVGKKKGIKSHTN